MYGQHGEVVVLLSTIAEQVGIGLQSLYDVVAVAERMLGEQLDDAVFAILFVGYHGAKIIIFFAK